MKKLIIILLGMSLATCKTSYQKQFSSCVESYTAKLEECKSEACKTRVVDAFQSCVGYTHLFPLHFVVLTDSLQGTDAEVTAELEAVVDTLNRYFTVEDARYPPDNRNKIISFSFKSATLFAESIAIGGDLVDHAQPNYDFDARHDFKDKVNNETNAALKADDAINVYIVDSWQTNTKGVYEDVISSNAKNNDNRPYMVLDYARINGKDQRAAAEEHEMGHCFKLAHVCVPGAINNATSTNIMASSGSYPQDNSYENGTGVAEAICKDGSPSGRMGKRDIGFNPEQCQIILTFAEQIKQELGL